jgi:hypothetical protein
LAGQFALATPSSTRLAPARKQARDPLSLLPLEAYLDWSEDGGPMAIRNRGWKVAFLEQNAESNSKTPKEHDPKSKYAMRIPQLLL